jgi:hypothetical protein
LPAEEPNETGAFPETAEPEKPADDPPASSRSRRKRATPGPDGAGPVEEERRMKQEGKRSRSTEGEFRRRLRTKTPFGAAARYGAYVEVLVSKVLAHLHQINTGDFSYLLCDDNKLKVIEVALCSLEDHEEEQQFCRDASAYVTNFLRRRRVEVSTKHLTKEELQELSAAKGSEIKSWLKEEVVRLLPEGMAREQDAMKLRWVVTWKTDDSDPRGKKLKARLVVLGFQDPRLGEREVNSPTMTRRSRGLFIQNAVNRRWTVYKADV